ncbi:MAG TPA: dienelactone hydrolase family protein [Gemmatimonadales bacterium]
MTEHRLTVPRSARYFSLGKPVREVWFVLHGYGQLAATFLAEFAALDDGARLVVAPEALSRYYVDHRNRKVGASWMTREDRLVEIEDYVRYLDAVYADVFRAVDRASVSAHVVGFSQGAATGSRWVAMGAARLDRLMLWGGEVPPDLPLERPNERDRLARSRLTLVLGSRDEFITDKVVARDTERLAAAGVPHRVVRYDGGHGIDERVLRQLTAEA